MTNREIIVLYECLLELQKKSVKFDVITCFRLSKNKYTLTPIYESIMESSHQLFEKYAVKVDSELQILPENVNKFWEEHNKLMKLETPIQLEEISIEDIKDLQIDLSTMEALLPIIAHRN